MLLWCISSHSRPALNLTMPFSSRQVPLHRLCPFHLDRLLRQAEAVQVNDTAVRACQGPTGRCEPLLGAGCTLTFRPKRATLAGTDIVANYS